MSKEKLKLIYQHLEDKLKASDNLQNYIDIYLDDNFENAESEEYKFVNKYRFVEIKNIPLEDLKKLIKFL